MQNLTATRVLLPGIIGPYDAHVDLADHWNGFVRPLFTLDTVRQIATDTQAQADECGRDDVITAHVIDGDTGRSGEHRAVVLVVNWPYWGQDGGAKKATNIVEPTTYGLYGIGGSSWSWEFQTWDCRCEEKNPWHVTVCQCGELRDMQVAAPKGMRATRVSVDGSEAYPAFVAEHARYGQHVTPHFTLDTVRQLAVGTQEAAAQHDPRSAETVHVLETAPDTGGNRGVIVLHIDWFTEVDEGPKDAVRTIVPTEHGLYAVGSDWHWKIAGWWCVCDQDNLWNDNQCNACGLARAEQPKTGLDTAVWKVGRVLRTLVPAVTAALVDLTHLGHICAVFAGDVEVDLGDDTGPFDAETLGEADEILRQALDEAAGDLTGSGWERVPDKRSDRLYRITFPAVRTH
ncbi:hypothetical protein [Streptomyces sp. NPDC006334]|uniref:hypothetical protein n=1 Tax=Streptomyces sp. NPDC006334 TaxID=3156754 RepID=UPI0033B73F22